MQRGVEAQIAYLLNYELTERISNKGILNIKDKGRLYNPPKPPSKILTKVAASLYNKQFPKESKPTRRIRNLKVKPEGGADVLIKHDKYDDGVTQVNGDRFSDFINEFEDSQNNKRNPLSVELKLRIEIKNNS